MKSLSRDMIIPKFGEYKYYHETELNPDFILFWISGIATIFKKEIIVN